MTYKIDKDIPVRQPRFPFAQMEVGDSFLVENRKEAIAATVAAMRAGFKAKTRAQPDGKVRVWRIE